MGLLDQVMGAVKGKLPGAGQQNELMNILMGLLNNPELGGLSGLVQKFKDKGLGSAVDSWISTGKNQAVSGDQMRNALGDNIIQQIAGKVGLGKDAVSGQIADLLPKMIDKLTPDGKLPQGDLIEQGLNMLKKSFLGK
jgi:uncharacterized protein YidB (DUF937 family)